MKDRSNAKCLCSFDEVNRFKAMFKTGGMTNLAPSFLLLWHRMMYSRSKYSLFKCLVVGAVALVVSSCGSSSTSPQVSFGKSKLGQLGPQTPVQKEIASFLIPTSYFQKKGFTPLYGGYSFGVTAKMRSQLESCIGSKFTGFIDQFSEPYYFVNKYPPSLSSGPNPVRDAVTSEAWIFDTPTDASQTMKYFLTSKGATCMAQEILVYDQINIGWDWRVSSDSATPEPTLGSGGVYIAVDGIVYAGNSPWVGIDYELHIFVYDRAIMMIWAVGGNDVQKYLPLVSYAKQLLSNYQASNLSAGTSTTIQSGATSSSPS
ncbi:MAG: hypothetical protein HKL80_08890 [Acidimicrobiales bacterium]|nr:hypothetical protein [Acidimicrobiales bacterium]